MGESFQFVTASRIVFGRNRFDEVGTLTAELGRSALIVSNADRHGESGLMARTEDLLSAAGVEAVTLWISGEPEIADVDRGLEAARDAGCDVVLGLGGGSAIDTAKAVAGLLTNGGSCLDYMEVIGDGKPIREPSAPWIAVPTTAGTGAEVTRNAVIGSKEPAYKASIRSPLLLARVALVDPVLALGVRAEVTARSGLDALTQCIESYTSRGANPLTDGLARQGISRAAGSLRRAASHGADIDAREEMALSALLSGIALTNAGLGAVHGFAAPVGASYPVPHGAVCGLLLPHVMRANVAALREADRRHPWLARYAEIGRLVRGDSMPEVDAAIDSGLAFTERLVRDLELPGLASFGLSESAIPDMVARARGASSMRFNPIALSEARLSKILADAL